MPTLTYIHKKLYHLTYYLCPNLALIYYKLSDNTKRVDIAVAVYPSFRSRAPEGG
jgi:hypothetical protein